MLELPIQYGCLMRDMIVIFRFLIFQTQSCLFIVHKVALIS